MTGMEELISTMHLLWMSPYKGSSPSSSWSSHPDPRMVTDGPRSNASPGLLLPPIWMGQARQSRTLPREKCRNRRSHGSKIVEVSDFEGHIQDDSARCTLWLWSVYLYTWVNLSHCICLFVYLCFADLQHQQGMVAVYTIRWFQSLATGNSTPTPFLTEKLERSGGFLQSIPIYLLPWWIGDLKSEGFSNSPVPLDFFLQPSLLKCCAVTTMTNILDSRTNGHALARACTAKESPWQT